MIVYINGWPGVGKLTVGRIVAEHLGARLVDNHTMLNPGFAVAGFGTPTSRLISGKIRELVYEQMVSAPAEQSFVLTDAFEYSESSKKWFEAIINVAEQRGVSFVSVILDCELD